jgi:capsular polysaccharide transport system permease protein
MLIARAALELASTTVVLVILLSAVATFGFGEWPADPLKVGAALLLMAWFSFGFSLLVAFLSHESHAFARLVHPALYLSLPLSGAFFSMLWFSAPIQHLLAWVPTVPMFELMRAGQFDGYPLEYAGLAYPLACCGLMTVLGLAGLRLMRKRVQV